MQSDYYSDPHVRARLLEFLGGSRLDEVTAQFITADGRGMHRWYDPRPVSELWQCAADTSEVARSLWDRDSLIAHLDMEYVNFDYPAEPYLHPERAFHVQRPVVEAVEEILLRHGIAPLHVLSGRGHHFVWRMDRGSVACARLAEASRLPESVEGKYLQPQPPCGEFVSPDLAAAFAGLGLVMEYLAHLVLTAVGDRCEIPVELTAVEVGPIKRGREIVSIDLSEYGDPLHTRTTRMPFSYYQKPQHCLGWPFDGQQCRLQPLFVIPLHEMNERQGLVVMRDAEEVRALARRASVQIPDQSSGMINLVNSYRTSSLARFHDDFYQTEHDPPLRWPETYDLTPLDPLPKCASQILRYPNDLLLKPAGIQHVARTLLAVGWHPRHIAGLIRSIYERNYNWGPTWLVYDAALRADFYTRLFTGLVADGLDPLIDFNCKSTQEKGYCCSAGCGHILEDHRIQLVERTRALQSKHSLPTKRSDDASAVNPGGIIEIEVMETVI